MASRKEKLLSKLKLIEEEKETLNQLIGLESDEDPYADDDGDVFVVETHHQTESENGSETGDGDAEKIKPSVSTKSNTKNPLNLSRQQVIDGLKDGTYRLGKVPKGEKATAKYWNSTMFFIFDSSGSVIPNWYGCNKCDWITNTVREKGTGVLNNHVARHDTQLYRLNKSQLSAFAHNVSIYGDVYGTISEETFLKYMPNAKSTWWV